MAVAPSEACFVGDHIEWDVRAPQALGVTGVWVNAGGRPATAGVPPDATIEALPELVPLLAGARSSARLGRGGGDRLQQLESLDLELARPIDRGHRQGIEVGALRAGQVVVTRAPAKISLREEARA